MISDKEKSNIIEEKVLGQKNSEDKKIQEPFLINRIKWPNAGIKIK